MSEVGQNIHKNTTTIRQDNNYQTETKNDNSTLGERNKGKLLKADEPIDVAFNYEAHLLLTRGKQSYQGENQLKDMVDERKQITEHEGIFGIERKAQLLYGNANKYGIYQLMIMMD